MARSARHRGPVPDRAWQGRGIGVFGAGQPGDQSDGNGTEDSESSAGSSRQASTTTTKNTPKVATNKRVIAIGVAIVAVAAAGVTYAVTQHSPSTPAAAAAVPPIPKGPLYVRSITPSSHETGVNGAAPIVVTFSAPVAANSPDPQLTPAVAGTWSTEGNSMVFTPTQAYGPAEHVTVQVPAGVRDVVGGLLATAVTEQFTTGSYTQGGLR